MNAPIQPVSLLLIKKNQISVLGMWFDVAVIDVCPPRIPYQQSQYYFHKILYIHKSMDTASNQWIGLFQPHLLRTGVYNGAHSHAIAIDKHWQENGLTEELTDFQCGTVIRCHLSNNSLSNFCPARAASVNSKCCYCEVETSRSNNGSAAKWQATQPHRTGLPRAEARSDENLGQ